ncbi:hypothetical protein GCM10022255_079000 [Dactylosporangium darangshiense]|uniref:Uncharacterized protein n=1 Tax=Dactylosporangium darangshiense TaxID=579108 RepID=A0ABP8DKN9_9ACTN
MPAGIESCRNPAVFEKTRIEYVAAAAGVAKAAKTAMVHAVARAVTAASSRIGRCRVEAGRWKANMPVSFPGVVRDRARRPDGAVAP